MKTKSIPTIIAIAIGLLIAYGLYNFHKGDNKVIIAISSFISITLCLIFSLGVKFEFPRSNAVIKATSAFFFLLALIANVIFTFVVVSVPTIVITNGIVILVLILIVYSINQSKQ